MESGLLARKETLTARSIGRIPERVDYADYREAAGAKVPAIALMNPRKAARFERLMSLKKDLLQGLVSSVKERALR